MNTKLFKLLTAGALLLLSSCGDSSIEASNEGAPVQTTATLSVLVKDAVSNASLKASVKLSTGAQDSTNASGFVYFKGVPTGTHRVLVEKAGYASVVVESNIQPNLIENVYIANDASVSASLPPRTAGLEGVVYFEDKNGSSKPPTSAMVRFVANTNLNLVDNVFEVPVSATNGKFTFDSLPAIGSSYTLYVLDAAADGQKYAAKSFPGAALVKGTTVSLTSAIRYTAADLTDLFELTSYNSVIKSTDTLSLVFSDSIDAAKFKPEMITLDSKITTAVKKIVAGKTLKLVNSDKWPSSFTFTVGNNLPIISVKGKSYSTNSSKTVYVDGLFELVSYKPTIKGKDTLVLEFSDSIDATKFRKEMITLSNNNIVAEKIVAGKTLKLVPADNWPNSFTFTIGGDNASAANNLVSVKGMTYYTTNPRQRTVYMEGIFELVSYKSVIKSKDTLVLEFSDSIDVAKFKNNQVSYNNYSGTFPTVDIKVDGKLLILVPATNWPSSFSFYVSNIQSIRGTTYNTGDYKPVYVEGFFELASYKEIIKSTDTLVLVFSDSIDAAKFKSEFVSFSDYYPSNMPTVEKKVDGKQLMLIPSGNWPSSFKFTISGIVSVRGITCPYTQKQVWMDGSFDIVSHSSLVKATDTVFVVFSDYIDAGRFRPTHVYIDDINSGTANKIVDGKVLKLVPIDKWPNTSFTFRISNDLLSIKGVGVASDGAETKTVFTEGYFNYVTHSPIPLTTPDTLVLEFTDNVDTNGIANLITSGSYPGGFNIKWVSTDGKKLKLMPKNKSRWTGYSSASSFSISASSSFKSVSGISYSTPNTPITVNVKAYPFTINTTTASDSLDPATASMTAPLIYEFSDSIDVAQLNKINTVRVSVNSSNCSSDLIAVEKSVVDGKKLNIALLPGGRWTFNSNNRFYVCFTELKSVNGVNYNNTINTVYREVFIKQRTDLASVVVENLGIFNNPTLTTPDSLYHTSTYTILAWKKVPFLGYYSASNNYPGGYRIYKKEGTGNFVYYGNTTQPGYAIVGQDTMCYYNSVSWSSGALEDGKTVSFIVVPYNDLAEGSRSLATPWVMKDLRSPTFNSGSPYGFSQVAPYDTLAQWAGYVPTFSNYSYDSEGIYFDCLSCESGNSGSGSGQGYWGNTWGWQPNWISYSRNEFKFDKLYQTSAVSYQYQTNFLLRGKYYNNYIIFNEPMDTTSLAIVYNGTRPARFSIEKGWNNDGTQLYLNPVIAAGAVDDASESFTVHLTGLKDKAGNDIVVTYNNLPYIVGGTTTKNNIGFKFTPVAVTPDYP